jgi:hypothetical protein
MLSFSLRVSLLSLALLGRGQVDQGFREEHGIPDLIM